MESLVLALNADGDFLIIIDECKTNCRVNETYI